MVCVATSAIMRSGGAWQTDRPSVGNTADPGSENYRRNNGKKKKKRETFKK